MGTPLLARALLFLVLVAGFIAGGVFYGHARDGGDTPQDALRQYKHMQETQRMRTQRPAPNRRTKVRASPFSLPTPQRLKQPTVPPSIFVHVIGDSLAGQVA